MKKDSLFLIIAGAAVFVVVGALYSLRTTFELNVTSASRQSQDIPGAVSRTGSADPESDFGQSTIPAETAQPRIPTKVEAVDPAKYASLPAKPSYEKEIITLATRLDIPDLDKAKVLLARVTTLPPSAKVLAMEHAAQLIPDKNYVQMRPTLFQLATSDELRETVLTDVLNRDDKVRMPTLVEMLRQPANAAQPEIREILVAYLDEDAGNDFAKWNQAVEKFLRENPEE